MARHCRWGTILAGGEGSRLRSMTRLVTGDDRPKQFCSLFGGRTLLAETIARLANSVEPACTVYVVSRKDELYYGPELRGIGPSRVLEQPSGRGTTAAIAYALVRIRRLADQPIVGFFPADHYFANDAALRRVLCLAYAAAAAEPDRVVLIGAKASVPETGYGWIEPLAPARSAGRALKVPAAVRAVAQFWEKPSVDVAADLLRRRCLWNTFITIGRLETFVALLDNAVPDLWRRFAALDGSNSPQEEAAMVDALYSEIGSSDFSRDVLTNHPHRLAVAELADSGWTDLGQPSRVLDIMARTGVQHPSLRFAAVNRAVSLNKKNLPVARMNR
jgi:mannose-1-phosphate guanylyltransferase